MRLSKRCFSSGFMALLVALVTSGADPAATMAAPGTSAAGIAPTPAPEVHVNVKMLADVKAVQAGHPFKLGVELEMDPGWHTYYKECGDAGMPTKIKWSLPPGFTASELLWQKPTRFDEGGIVTYGYAGKTLIAANITPPATLKDGAQLKFDAEVTWLSCKEICLPGNGPASLTLSVGKAEPDNQSQFVNVTYNGPAASLFPPSSTPKSGNGNEAGVADSKSGASENSGASHNEPDTSGTASGASEKFAGSSSSLEGKSGANDKSGILNENLKFASGEQSTSLPVALLLALCGGFILNFMPCVLPVIAIKVLGLIEQSHVGATCVKRLGLTFSAGIISSFLVLAAVALLVQSAGQQVGWGFQFQYPGFIIAMSVIVLLFALSLFGLFYVSVGGCNSNLNELANKEGYVGTFFKGVLATVLSTPCSAPFLGPALGFAFTQSKLNVVLIFFMIGLGMAAPYLLLSLKPDWIRFIPKPGVWMEKLKESFGFILLATVVWLLYVLGSESGIEAVTWTSSFLVTVAFAAWLISRFTDLNSTQERKIKVWSLAAVVVLGSFYFCIATRPGIGFIGDAAKASNTAAAHDQVDNGIPWQPLDLKKLDEYRNQGKTVLLDFTAQWCLTCKVNEQTVLSNQAVVDKLKDLKVVTMRADWTSQDATITKLLHKFNRSGVPLYVIFPGSKSDEPIVLPEVITTSLVLSDLDQAGPSKN